MYVYDDGSCGNKVIYILVAVPCSCHSHVKVKCFGFDNLYIYFDPQVTTSKLASESHFQYGTSTSLIPRPLGEGTGNEARNKLKAATIGTSTEIPPLLTGRETSHFAYMDCDDAGSSHFHKVIMVPFHPTLV